MSLINLLLILLVASFLGVLPLWPHSQSWGYGPGGMLLLVVIVVFALSSSGRLKA